MYHMWTQILISRPWRIDDQVPAEPTLPAPEITARALNIQRDNRSNTPQIPMLLREFLYGYRETIWSQSLFMIHMLIKVYWIASQNQKILVSTRRAFTVLFYWQSWPFANCYRPSRVTKQLVGNRISIHHCIYREATRALRYLYMDGTKETKEIERGHADLCQVTRYARKLRP